MTTPNGTEPSSLFPAFFFIWSFKHYLKLNFSNGFIWPTVWNVLLKVSLVWCPIIKMSCAYHLNVRLEGNTKWYIPQGAGAAKSRGMKRKTGWGSLERGTYDFWSMSMVHVVGEALTAGRFIQPKKKVWSRLLTDSSHPRWFSLLSVIASDFKRLPVNANYTW